MAFLYRVMKQKWISPPKDVKESYAGRNIIVTGATSGIGLEAVVKFAALGASKVIIAARNLKKADEVKQNIEARIGSKGQLEVWQLDMDSYDSIVAFAERANKLDHLDVAVLNAGLRKSNFGKLKYGWEEDLQVNTISTVLLAILLLPKLKASKGATSKIPILEFVNSGTHQRIVLDPDVVKSDSILQGYNIPERFSAQNQYGLSKLFLMFATNKLAEETSSGDVIITSVCPGMVGTDLSREVKFPGVSVVLAIIGFFVLKSPEQGGRVILSGTTQGESVHGRFWQYDIIQPVAPAVAGEENKKIGLRVWNEIVESLSGDVPVVKEALSAVVRA
jgi:NAD(P)-dependent dehydrogenase (short-subunit alcohol dehydrogenase family)